MEAEETDNAGRLIRAEVRDDTTDQTFAVEMDIWSGGEWHLETDCNCRYAHACVHAAAVLFALPRGKDLVRFLGGAPAGPAVKPKLLTASELLHEPPAALPEIKVEPRFALHITRDPAGKSERMMLQALGRKETEDWISAAAFACYDNHRISLRSAAPDWTTEVAGPDGRRAIVRHSSGAETIAAQQLRDTGLTSLQSSPTWRFLLNLHARERGGEKTPDRWFPDPGHVTEDAFWHQFRGEAVAKLEALGWTVEFDDNVGHQVFDAPPEEWDTSLDDMQGGWFSLSVGFEVAGERHDLLPILAGLLESDFLEETLDRPDGGYVYAPLPGGSALKLPIGRVRRILQYLAALIDPKHPGKTRLHALDAASVAGISGLGLETPKSLEDLAAKLRDFSGIDPVPVPQGLRAELREYQTAGFRWMQFLASHHLHGILADDMGLGKTLQTLAHLLAEKESGRSGGKPSLVVAPTSVVPNWRAEATRFAPGLRILVLQGAERSSYFRSIPHADVVLTSFALLQRDIEKLRAHTFHIVALDEAQNIKNPRAKVAQAACKLDARHRLCLSGTPVENHLGELWSLMRFLMPGFLGSEETFNKQFRNPIEKDQNEERQAALKRRVAPLILRRTKNQVAKELPPKTELVHLVELHTAQKDLYETVRATMNKRVRDAIAARGLGQSRIVFLDALLKLRQICCDPRLLPEEFSNKVRESAKLDYLIELLDTLLEEGRRILIFSQFTSMLALIEDHLTSRGIRFLKLTGASKDRGKLVEDFQTGRVPLFLISLKAGGTGLNLTAADTVIHYDPWWNPAAEAQATDRAYRIGQDKPVFVHKLLCQETVEERIHKLQQDKSKLADALLADSDLTSGLDPSMLRALLES
jgi:hypothetical protein